MKKIADDRIEAKTEHFIPGNIRLIILILNAVISSNAFSSDKPISSLLLSFLYTLPGLILFFSRTKVIITPEEILNVTDFIIFKLKSEFYIQNFQYVYFTSKNKTFSSIGGLRPAAKEFYSMEFNEVVLCSKDLKTKQILGNLTNKEDAQKVIKLLTKNHELNLYEKPARSPRTRR